MGTLIGEIVGLVIVVWVLWRYVAPPVRRMMNTRQGTVQNQLEESEKAKTELANAQRAHQDAVEKARLEAARIREDARADAQRISEQLRSQADAEVERIKQQGAEQVTLHRQHLIRQLRADLGNAAVAQARIKVREELSDEGARSASVDRFLDELESMAGSDHASAGDAAPKTNADNENSAENKNSGVS